MSLHGFIDLLSRRAVDLASGLSDENAQVQPEILKSLNISALAGAGKTPQLVAMSLQSLTGPSIDIDISELEVETMNEFAYLGEYSMTTPLRMLLMCCYEAVIDTHRDPNVPIWEFFRHCRNAAAHDGKFSFKPHEPSRPAEWRGLKIECSLEGRPLLIPAEGESDPFLKPGDVLRLISDVEQLFSPRP
jgi:hypothetical protein